MKVLRYEPVVRFVAPEKKQTIMEKVQDFIEDMWKQMTASPTDKEIIDHHKTNGLMVDKHKEQEDALIETFRKRNEVERKSHETVDLRELQDIMMGLQKELRQIRQEFSEHKQSVFTEIQKIRSAYVEGDKKLGERIDSALRAANPNYGRF